MTTDLLDDDVKDILKASEERWEIEKCFRIMKTDFADIKEQGFIPLYTRDKLTDALHEACGFLASEVGKDFIVF